MSDNPVYTENDGDSYCTSCGAEIEGGLYCDTCLNDTTDSTLVWIPEE